jgi:putative ABC transport system substrate-binding protein
MNCAGAALIGCCSLVLSLAPAKVYAQPQGKKIARVAVLAAGPLTPQRQRNYDVLRDSLRGHGWVEGRNVTVEYHHGEERPDRLAEVSAALARTPPDVIVAFGGDATIRVVQEATRSVPIVMIAAADPVQSGFVRSLARPGGNTTGTTVQHAELAAKRLELLREAVPNVKRVAVLYRIGDARLFEPMQRAAQALGIQLQMHQVSDPGEIDGAFDNMRRDKAGALLVMTDSVVLERKLRTVASLASKYKLPAIYPWRTYLDLADGLMSYGPNLPGMNRRAAYFVDRILRGTKPADLPVELPREFELVINLKSASAIGLTISQKLQLQADEIKR